MKCEKWKNYRFDQISRNCDKMRIPLSSAQRAKKQGIYSYYGAQGVIDHIDDYIFDGTYMLIAEDGENLKSKKQNIAQLANGQFWVNNHAHIVSNNQLSDIRFLCFKFNSTDVSGYITGSAQPKLSQTNLNSIIFDMPPLPEQKAIADTLSCLDDKIELNNRMNRTLEKMAQAIFKSWFVDFEPFQDGGFVDSELGSIPKGWRAGTLGELAEISTKSINPSKTPETLFEHYSIPSYDEASFPVFEKGNNIKSNKYLIPCDAWLISKLNPTTKRVWQPFMLSKNAICSTEFIVYSASNLRYRDFCFESTNSADFFDFLCSNTSGSTNSRQRAIPKETLKYQLVIPSENIVKAFSQLVDPIYEEMKNNLVECQRLISLRNSLLPKLMNGEIRVPIEVK